MLKRPLLWFVPWQLAPVANRLSQQRIEWIAAHGCVKTMFQVRWGFFLAISAGVSIVSMSRDIRGESELSRVPASLASVACPPHKIFDGLEIHYTTRTSLVDRSVQVQSEVFVYSQLSPRVWRLDLVLADGEKCHVCRYDDLGYSVVGGQYRRVGFEPAVHLSIYGTALGRNPLVSEATEVLGEPLPDMLRFHGFVFESLEAPIHKGGTRRAIWRHGGSIDGIPPASGVIEWREEQVGALITHLEYRRQPIDAIASTDITIDVEYREWSGRLLPSRARRNNGTVILETVLDSVGPAIPDRAHYSPQAFGLDMPRRPWNRWFLAGAIFVIGALMAGAGRWFSNR
jgi:hypothetical protein